MSIGPLDITNVFGGNNRPLPTSPPTDEIGSTNMWSVNVPGWYSYVSDSLEKSPELQWPQSIQTYSDMRHDAQIQGLYLGTTLPLRRYHWLLDPNDCDKKQVLNLAKDLSLNVKEYEPLPRQKYRDRFDFGKHLQDALISLVMGHYPFEQVGEIGDDGKWHLTKLAPRPPETITEINIDALGDLVGFKQLFSSQMIPANRVTWYAWMMEGANWTGRSMLRACYRNWLRKDRLLRVDAQKQERNGIGIPIAEAPPGMSGAALLRLDMLMRKLRAGDTSGGAVPNGTKVSLVGTTGTLPDTVASIKLDNEEMARAWLEMFMQLGQTQTGSRALGSEFIDFFSDAIDEMANWFCANFTASVIENWWDWNVDPDADATPQLIYTRNPDSAFSGREFAMLIQRGAIVVDDELENAIRERYGLPNRSPGLPRPQSAQVPGAIPWPPAEGVVTPPSSGETSPAGEGPMSDEPVYGGRGGSERTVRAFMSPSPVTLPNRPLRRELYAHELRAAVDWGSADANWQQNRDQLVAAVRKPQLQQIDELHDQLVEAGNSLLKIGAIQAPPLLEDIIFTHMSVMASLGAHDAQHEAQRQNVTLQLPDLTQLSEDQRERAKVVDQFLADTLSSSAKSSAFIYAGGSLAGKDIADKVKNDLINLGQGFLSDQLGGALTAAMNAGRKATMAVAEARINSVKAGKPVTASRGAPVIAQADDSAGMTIYASELLDDATCDPCAQIDGTEYMTLDDAEEDYPSGGYTDCDGWSRCRGTLVAVYGEVPEEPTDGGVTPEEEAFQQVTPEGPVTYPEAPSLNDVLEGDKLSATDQLKLKDSLKQEFPDAGIHVGSPVLMKGNIGEFSTLDPTQMSDIGKALADVQHEFPEVIAGTGDNAQLSQITFASSTNLSGPAADIQEAMLNGDLQGAKAITYEIPQFGGDTHYGIMVNDTIRAVEDMGITDGPVQSTYDMTVHELGHQYANVHGITGDMMQTEMSKFGLTFNDFTKISDYAATNPDEAFAEAFANTNGLHGEKWEFYNTFDDMVKDMSQFDSFGNYLPEISQAAEEVTPEVVPTVTEEVTQAPPEIGEPTHLPTEDWQTSYGSADDARTFADEHFTSDLTSAERDVVSEYGGNGYTPINKELRYAGKNDVPISPTKKTYQGTLITDAVKNIDSAIQTSTVDQDITVFRGIPEGTAKKMATETIQPGTIVSDHGYMSTTLRRQVTNSFGGTELEIRIPKGTSALSMDQAGTASMGESEVLLPRDTQLRVISVDRAPSYTTYGGGAKEYISHMVLEVV